MVALLWLLFLNATEKYSPRIVKMFGIVEWLVSMQIRIKYDYF